MEEIMSLIFQGCKLARDLELNLLNLANQPHILKNNCDEIIRIFSDTRDRINAEVGGGDRAEVVAGAMPQWMSRYSRAQPSAAPEQVVHPQREAGLMEGIVGPNFDLREMGRWAVSGSGGGGGDAGEVQPMNVADTGRSSSVPRTRRRKDDADKQIIRVAAPRMGNTEIPPEDGFTWRKYGQKEILGSRFPRGYYRCTHQKLYHCPAKKQVQRLDDDPFMFEVAYRGHHTCTMSSTAPSASVPKVNVEIGMRPPNTESGTDIIFSNFSLGGATTTTGDVVGHVSGGAGGGPSSAVVRFGREPDQYYQPVAEFADAMFNSGSSSSSNMDLIFSAGMEDKWDPSRGD